MTIQCISPLAGLDLAGLRSFAGKLGSIAGAGDIVLLIGPLGVGKSEFARAYIRRALCDPETEVPSPSFTLAQYYETSGGELRIVHADLYRLEDSGEAEELGLSDTADHSAMIIEWADRLPNDYFDDPLRLELSHTDTPGLRLLKASGSNRWMAKIAPLENFG